MTVRGEGMEVTFKQIAGLIARRIVFNHGEGERVERGQRVGLIKFGSRDGRDSSGRGGDSREDGAAREGRLIDARGDAGIGACGRRDDTEKDSQGKRRAGESQKETTLELR